LGSDGRQVVQVEQVAGANAQQFVVLVAAQRIKFFTRGGQGAHGIEAFSFVLSAFFKRERASRSSNRSRRPGERSRISVRNWLPEKMVTRISSARGFWVSLVKISVA
jgi:hypothetical protein